jgi:hypothetical protein
MHARTTSDPARERPPPRRVGTTLADETGPQPCQGSTFGPRLPRTDWGAGSPGEPPCPIVVLVGRGSAVHQRSGSGRSAGPSWNVHRSSASSHPCWWPSCSPCLPGARELSRQLALPRVRRRLQCRFPHQSSRRRQPDMAPSLWPPPAPVPRRPLTLAPRRLPSRRRRTSQLRGLSPPWRAVRQEVSWTGATTLTESLATAQQPAPTTP